MFKAVAGAAAGREQASLEERLLKRFRRRPDVPCPALRDRPGVNESDSFNAASIISLMTISVLPSPAFCISMSCRVRVALDAAADAFKARAFCAHISRIVAEKSRCWRRNWSRPGSTRSACSAHSMATACRSNVLFPPA